MELKKLYEKNIDRYINPAVVVSELDEKHIEQEIDEYIFTKVIVQNLYKFLDPFLNKREGKTGVWISGYYGSGKSHFIKYLFYLLNKNTRELSFERLKDAVKDLGLGGLDEVSLSDIDSIQKQLDKTEVEEIIFNIDAVAGPREEKNILTRILLHQLNKIRGYNTANLAVASLIEKELDKKGKFVAFKDKIEEKIGEKWIDKNVNKFIRRQLDAVLNVAHEIDNSIDKDSLRQSIMEDVDISIEDFITELKDYLETKEENYRLIFLMDEVSQYIGTNRSLLLNLQTIVEEIGSKIGNKVWIVCTAQQDLSDLVSDNIAGSKSDEFGKIMGRFETMISLQAQDAAYITQKRVLGKSSEGIKALSEFYRENRIFIENQFVFGHDLYTSYKDEEDFYLAYPFIPYQFRLISDVFQSFSYSGFVGEGVKNTERSILGITHYTAQLHKDKPLGYFISFDDFFNNQLRDYLTHNAREILDKALTINFEKEDKDFSQKVIHALFMISNLSSDVKVNFSANIENLTLLLINDVNVVKKDVELKVQRILDKLVEENIVQVSEGVYNFLDDEEIKIAKEIANTTVQTNEKLNYFYNQFIQKLLRPEAQVNIGTRSVKTGLAIDDLIKANGDAFDIKFICFELGDIQQLALSLPDSTLTININTWMNQDNKFQQDFMQYCRTSKYLSENRALATGTHLEKIEKFASRNQANLKDLQTRFSKKFVETPIISKNTVYNSDSFNSQDPEKRYEEMVRLHVKSIFLKHEMSQHLASSNEELRTYIQRSLTMPGMDKELDLAEAEVNNRIRAAGDEVSLSQLVKSFEKAPYGWRDLATLQAVFGLALKKYREIFHLNEEIRLKDYFENATNSRTRESMEVKKPKDYDPEEINLFKDSVKDVFIDITFRPDENDAKEIVEKFKEYLQPLLIKVNALKEEHAGYPFQGKLREFHSALKDIHEIRSEDKLMKKLIEEKERLKPMRDEFLNLKDFIENNFEQYDKIRKFIEDQRSNLENLEDFSKEELEEIQKYFREEELPGEQFPYIRKKHKELKDSLRKRLNSLKEEVTETYNTIFDELEARRLELKIEDPNLLPSREFKISKLNSEKSISSLEIRRLEAGDFKLENLKLLAENAAATTVGEGRKKTLSKLNLSSDIRGKTINNPQDVEKLIEKLREKLMEKLKDGETLFLE